MNPRASEVEAHDHLSKRKGVTRVPAIGRGSKRPFLARLGWNRHARDDPVGAPYHDHWRHATEVLAEPWRLRGRRRALLRAGIAVALSFDTWRTLTREQRLSDNQAVELMLRLTCDCAHDPNERTRNAPAKR